MRSAAVLLALMVGGILVAKYYPTSLATYAVCVSFVYVSLRQHGHLAGVTRWRHSNPARAQIIVDLILILLVAGFVALRL